MIFSGETFRKRFKITLKGRVIHPKNLVENLSISIQKYIHIYIDSKMFYDTSYSHKTSFRKIKNTLWPSLEELKMFSDHLRKIQYYFLSIWKYKKNMSNKNQFQWSRETSWSKTDRFWHLNFHCIFLTKINTYPAVGLWIWKMNERSLTQINDWHGNRKNMCKI